MSDCSWNGDAANGKVVLTLEWRCCNWNGGVVAGMAMLQLEWRCCSWNGGVAAGMALYLVKFLQMPFSGCACRICNNMLDKSVSHSKVRKNRG